MSAEGPEATSVEEQKEMEDKVTSPGRAEEAKLKAKYPHLGKKKQLWKGNKIFLFWELQQEQQLPTAAPGKTEVTGDHIPIPKGLPQWKPSLVASKLAGCLKELNCMNLLIPIISP
uniref:Uncharacterized protein n=1 Tax=Capra hircus TaxID=9925 RepID=A0A452EPK6_CAPHI